MPVLLKFNCGCGFVAEAVGEALAHADAQGHVLTAQGQIRPDVPSGASPLSRPRVLAQVEEDEA